MIDKINRPSWRLGATLGDWFSFRSYFSTSKASPNDPGIIVIVVIIIVGEAKFVLHSDGIIAQTVYLGTVFLFCEYSQPRVTEKMAPIAISTIKNRVLKL